MPYLAHFGLQEHPFTLTPDVDYFFPTHEHANIIGSVEFALRRDTGIIKVVGPVGTGKTLLCRLLIKKLVDSEAVAYINAPRANANSIILAVCREFGIDVGDDADSAYDKLNAFLVEEHAKNRLAILVVDEAQHLGKEGLELVRLVSNLETEKNKLLQIVLFGQTELDELLADPSLRQLTQRIAFSLETKPLTLVESKNYVNHRIRVSRRQGVEYDVFDPRAVELLARSCGGIPRVLNIVADKCLLAAFAAGSAVVQPAHVVEAIKESPSLVGPLAARTGRARRWLGRVAAFFGGLAAVAVVAAAILAAFPNSRAGQHVRAAIHALSGTGSPRASAAATPAPVGADRPATTDEAPAPVEASAGATTEPSGQEAKPENQAAVTPAVAPSAAIDGAAKQLATAAEATKPPPPAHRTHRHAKSATTTAKKNPAPPPSQPAAAPVQAATLTPASASASPATADEKADAGAPAATQAVH